MNIVKTIKGKKDIELWITHHNCSNNCRHCFMGPALNKGFLEETKTVWAASNSIGYDTHIYTTNPSLQYSVGIGL